MPEKLERCVTHVKDQGKSEGSAYAICNSSINEAMPDTAPYIRCENCRFFVQNGTCQLVQGIIDGPRGICKLYENGVSNPPETDIAPMYDQINAEYQILAPVEPNMVESVQVPLLSIGGEQIVNPNLQVLETLAIDSSLNGIDVLGLKKKKGLTEKEDDLGAPSETKNNALNAFVDSHMKTVAIPPWQYDIEQYTAIQEAIQSQFTYANPQYLTQVKQVMKEQHMEGKILLIKAAVETITDHRATSTNKMEKKYRRLLSATEIHAMARTGVGKGADINHYGPDFATGAKTLDSEADPFTGEMQLIVFEPDSEILQAIQSGTIQAVSINGGKPRDMKLNCDVDNSGECFTEPTGIILGEDDNIAFTYVVTDPRGMVWRGKYIPPAKPGIESTEIEILA